MIRRAVSVPNALTLNTLGRVIIIKGGLAGGI